MIERGVRQHHVHTAVFKRKGADIGAHEDTGGTWLASSGPHYGRALDIESNREGGFHRQRKKKLVLTMCFLKQIRLQDALNPHAGRYIAADPFQMQGALLSRNQRVQVPVGPWLF